LFHIADSAEGVEWPRSTISKNREWDSRYRFASGRSGDAQEVHRESDFGISFQLEEWPSSFAIERVEAFLASITK
jgi:hypothetical protein